jgi:thiamine-monophosphate kinase
MGARPVCFTIALSLPAVDEHWLEQFSSGLAVVAGMHNCPLVGGDMISSQSGDGVISFCVQVHGELPVGKAIRRSGARPGDLIYVSGTLGDAAAGLQVLRQPLQVEHPYAAERQVLVDAFFQPESRVSLGLALRDFATASIDISDGLASDLGHVLLASSVAAVVDLDALPLSKAFCTLIPESQRLALALGGGDDYELCFTVSPSQRTALERCLTQLTVPAICIGKIESGSGIRWQRGGIDVALAVQGYKHFATA